MITNRRTLFVAVACAAGLAGALAPVDLQGAVIPRAVSPGSATDIPTIGSRCPTFTWTTEPGAAGSTLSIWPVDETGEASGPHQRVEIPGDARSWTPSGEDCLEAGRSYAWRVGDSEPLLVRVAGGPWLDELLEEVVLEMVEHRRAAELASFDQRAATFAGSPAGSPPVLRSHASGSVSLHIDNGDFYGLWAGGESQGIFASASKAGGRAVYGLVTGGAGSAAGVTGITDSALGTGVYGFGETHGVQGISHEPTGIGVQGLQSGVYEKQGSGCGVGAESWADGGRGLTGLATAVNGTNYGIYGASDNPSGFDFFAAGTGTYDPFTGAHEVRLEGDPATLRPGMVVAATGRAEVRRGPDGSVGLSSTLPSVELARRPFDPAVLGVYVAPMALPADHWTEDRSGRFAIVNALGEGRVWVTDANGAVTVGDYLTTSAVPGYAQRQGDAVLRSHTLGKVTEAVDWERASATVEHDGRTYRAALVAVVYTSG